MITPNPAFSTYNQNQGFRAWAKARGYVARRQPEAMQGEGDVWGVPLNRKRGWLWDAGPSVGVHLTGAAVWRNGLAATLKTLPGFRLQTEAADAVLGWVAREAWGAAHEAVFGPRRFRVLEKPEGAVREVGKTPQIPRGFAARRQPGTISTGVPVGVAVGGVAT